MDECSINGKVNETMHRRTNEYIKELIMKKLYTQLKKSGRMPGSTHRQISGDSSNTGLTPLKVFTASVRTLSHNATGHIETENI